MKHLLVTVIASSGIVLLASCSHSKQLIAAKDAEISSLNSQLSAANAKLADGEKTIAQLKTENTAYGKEAEDCRKTKAAIAEKFDNLNKNLAEQGLSLQKIRDKAADAISKFEDAGATVTYKNGLVHINFEDRFFFKKNSAVVGVKGREALNTVAQVMRDNPNITAIVVGNTDTLSIKGVADNWTLSTERANAVVRVLDNVYYINPARLTAAGRSKFNPIASNDTEEGRMKNRRIEIILNPDLSRLWDMMEK